MNEGLNEKYKMKRIAKIKEKIKKKQFMKIRNKKQKKKKYSQKIEIRNEIAKYEMVKRYWINVDSINAIKY